MCYLNVRAQRSPCRRRLRATFIALHFVAVLFVADCLASETGDGPTGVYDHSMEAPLPPEDIADMVDETIKTHTGKMRLTLVCHPKPSTQPAKGRAAWVCLVDGTPVWVIASNTGWERRKASGMTARAIARARAFIAHREEAKRLFQGKETPRNWYPKQEALAAGYQAKEYGLQITEMNCVDPTTESWQVTVAPIKEKLGGQVWLRFSKGHGVSAEFGR